MKLLLKNDLGNLKTLATGLADFGRREDLPPELIYQLNIALDEIVTNTIQHGYEEGASHLIEVRLERERENVRATVSDDARPFNPFDAAEPDISLSIEDRKIGGLGIFLVRQLMDDFDYRRENGRNYVRLRKRLRSTPETKPDTK